MIPMWASQGMANRMYEKGFLGPFLVGIQNSRRQSVDESKSTDAIRCVLSVGSEENGGIGWKLNPS